MSAPAIRLYTPGAAFRDAASVFRAARATLKPPPKLQLSKWIEQFVVLPEGVSAQPGKVRLWPYQHQIADAIGDPAYERVTVVKPVRVGYSTLLASAVASFVANDPCPLILLLPTDDDARDTVVSVLEPIFAATDVVRGMLEDDSDGGERNTMTSRRFVGGSLKIIAAKAPRNLRRHTTRVLLIDEADAMLAGIEGSPIQLAEKRTLSFPDRKIVLGSTPLADDTSHVLRAFGESDQRVYEIPCAACGVFVELLWGMIEWQPDEPVTAAFRCPTCKALVPEAAKPAMVHAVRWRALKPDVKDHAGFRLNALISLLANASWAKLAAEFLRAKHDTSELQTFINCVLAQGWKEEGDEVDEAELRARAEPFSLDAMPATVRFLTAGTDVQGDWLETTVLGWGPAAEAPCVLGHIRHEGSPREPAEGVWDALDALLRQRWPHPFGGTLGIDAAIVDSGDATDHVYAFCFPRLRRRIWAGKGIAGQRQAFQLSMNKVKRHGDRGLSGRLVLVGVDTVKAGLFDRIGRNQVRFSDTLQADWFLQLASERKVVRYLRGQPIRSFERIPGRRAEALDCVTYAIAARAGLQGLDWTAREAALRIATPLDAPPQAPGTGGLRRTTYRFGAFT